MLVNEFLERSARQFPDKTALVCHGRRHTYAQIDGQADHVANRLVNPAVLSAQLVQQQSVESFTPRPVQEAHPVRICQGGR
jgi:non-ribosomal peptide synthetase component E (peptide arylation enzyme)